jgi:hypothetical protein
VERSIDDDRKYFGKKGLMPCRVDAPIWNGSNIRAPIMYFKEATALASIDQGEKRTTMSFALTDKPFVDDRHAHDQHYVLSVDPGIGLFRDEQATLHTPFIPELNEFYGRNAYFRWNAARSEPESLGVVTSVSTDHLSLRALNVSEESRSHFGVSMFALGDTPPKNGERVEDGIHRLPKLEHEVQPMLDWLSVNHHDFMRLNDFFFAAALVEVKRRPYQHCGFDRTAPTNSYPDQVVIGKGTRVGPR